VSIATELRTANRAGIATPRRSLAVVVGGDLVDLRHVDVGLRRRDRQAVGAGAGVGAIVGTAVGLTTGDARLGAAAGASAAVISGLITYKVVEHRQRQAQTAERERAERAAAERRRRLTEAEQREIQTNRALLAVPVGETETEQLVMLVDPATGQPIDDNVIIVPKSEIEQLASSEVPASKTVGPMAGDGAASPDSVEMAVPNDAPPQTVRFGRINNDRVIFRL